MALPHIVAGAAAPDCCFIVASVLGGDLTQGSVEREEKERHATAFSAADAVGGRKRRPISNLKMV
ncbi:uncharacterized protein G2W53_028334 [Senna tora]|uniref:Uncharacterized protein n=1 Tax=Senna tora TaxID=362788 RepID=A0A834T4A7_9FABA|nr:uncharacterized protein G2W53_028334 [Senna tora]